MPHNSAIMMRPEKKRRRPGFIRRLLPKTTPRHSSQRLLRFQPLERRQMLAGDLGLEGPLADITGLWVSVGNREYFTSEQASVTVDMFAGETLQVTGIRYGLDESVTPDHGVIAFESYVRREHGAAETGSYDYTNGRFADPVAEELVGGEIITHPGFDSGWQLEVIDNRVAVVAIRYFGDEFVVEDRLLFDVNVTEREEVTTWTETISPVRGEWETDPEQGVGGDSRLDDDPTGLTVIDTGSTGSDRYEIGVKAKTVEENTYANGFVVVDYRNENDFIYAGLRSIADKWVIGHFDGSFNDLATLKQDIQPKQVYDLRVAVDGSHVALAADGVFRISHEFDRSLDQGAVGLANQYAFTHFTDFHFFDNSTEPDGPIDLGTGTVTDNNGTTITFGDGNHTATPQSDIERAVQEARIAAEHARQASEAAVAAAQEAERIQGEAESDAMALENISHEAAAAAALAASAHREAQQAVEQAESQLAQASERLQEAEDSSKDARKAAKKAAKAADKDDDDDKEEDSESKKQKAVKKRDQGSRQLRDARAAYDAAARHLKSARLEWKRLAREAAEADNRAREAASEAREARQWAEHAAIEADNAREQASRLAREAEIASHNLAEAELALQQELQARQETPSEESEEGFRAYSLNFNHQDDGAFDTVAGRSERVAGQLHLVPQDDSVAVSVLDNDALPERTATRVYTTVRADELPGRYQNGFIVFDYQSPEDFKYAGAWAGADRWAIGEVIDGKLVDVATLDEVIGQGPAYELQVWIEDSTLTFLVEGQQKLQHTFDQPVDDGRIGVASYNARSRFDQVAVMQLYGGSGDVGIENAETDPEVYDVAINEVF